jgi:hypothetical protein
MNHCKRIVRDWLLLGLCLIGGQLVAPGQPVGDGRARRVEAYVTNRWEKVYADAGGATFKSVYAALLPLKKSFSLRWLWLGDDKGFMRLAMFDPESAAVLGPDKINPTAPYFALSKLDVSTPGELDAQAHAAVNAIYFDGLNGGYLLKGNTLYSTDNDGFSWRARYSVPPLPDNSAATLLSIVLMPSQRACMVGMYSQPDGVKKESLVFCTERPLAQDDPQWKRIEVTTQTRLFDVSFLDDKHGWIVGTLGTILKTDDSGRSWRQIPIEAESLRQSYFLDEKNGWSVGYLGSIWRSTDGGETWQQIRPSFYNQLASITLNSIKFAPNRLTGWIVGDQGTILYTSDGGNNWQQQLPPPSKEAAEAKPNLNALFVDDTFCWAVGDKSTVWRYRWR